MSIHFSPFCVKDTTLEGTYLSEKVNKVQCHPMNTYEIHIIGQLVCRQRMYYQQRQQLYFLLVCLFISQSHRYVKVSGANILTQNTKKEVSYNVIFITSHTINPCNSNAQKMVARARAGLIYNCAIFIRKVFLQRERYYQNAIELTLTTKYRVTTCFLQPMPFYLILCTLTIVMQ